MPLDQIDTAVRLPVRPHRPNTHNCGIRLVLNVFFADIVNIVEIGRFGSIFPTGELLDIVHLNIILYFQPPYYIRLGMLSASNYFELIIILNWSCEY